MTINDLLGGHKNDKNDSSLYGTEESVVSKAAEPSWFAAWFRKGNVAGGHQERADTMLHYSDLSWRRMKKVAKEVNMSGLARESVNALFNKYPKSRYLEIKGITLEEYDEAMRDCWVSAWENMNDSLRRFGRSIHYERYLASIGQLTIRKITNNDDSITPQNDNQINNNMGIVIRQSTENLNNNENNNGTKKKWKFGIGAMGIKKNKNIDNNYNNHTRTAPVIM